MRMAVKCTDPTRPSFEEIYQKYHRRLMLFACKMTGDQLAAEDIATETLLKYWHKQSDFTNEFAIKAFLDISTKNACVNYKLMVRRKNEKENGYHNIVEKCTDSIISHIVRTELIIEVWNIVETLSTECKRVILLAYVEGASNKDIARRLNISANTVKNHKYRGIQIVREKLKSQRMVATAR